MPTEIIVVDYEISPSFSNILPNMESFLVKYSNGAEGLAIISVTQPERLHFSKLDHPTLLRKILERSPILLIEINKTLDWSASGTSELSWPTFLIQGEKRYFVGVRGSGLCDGKYDHICSWNTNVAKGVLQKEEPIVLKQRLLLIDKKVVLETVKPAEPN